MKMKNAQVEALRSEVLALHKKIARLRAERADLAEKNVNLGRMVEQLLAQLEQKEER